jgi:hypothetical protein
VKYVVSSPARLSGLSCLALAVHMVVPLPLCPLCVSRDKRDLTASGLELKTIMYLRVACVSRVVRVSLYSTLTSNSWLGIGPSYGMYASFLERSYL